MSVHGRHAARRTTNIHEPKEVLRCGDAGIGPTSATLVLPAEDPPAGPSVKSQTLPAASATSDQGPAAACACGSAAKFSMRQKSGPAGNSSTFFSASGFATSDCWAIAVGM